MVELPVTSEFSAYDFRTTLEGTVYTFNIRYNERMDRWVFDILTSSEEQIIMGVPILLGVNLLGMYQDKRLPLGVLFAINLKDELVEAKRDDLGTNVLLLYQPSTEI